MKEVIVFVCKVKMRGRGQGKGGRSVIELLRKLITFVTLHCNDKRCSAAPLLVMTRVQLLFLNQGMTGSNCSELIPRMYTSEWYIKWKNKYFASKYPLSKYNFLTHSTLSRTVLVRSNNCLIDHSRAQVLEQLRKVNVGELGSFADFFVLLLLFAFGGNTMNLGHGSPLCSVSSRFHPILLKILLNINHITRKFNSSEYLFQLIINLDRYSWVIGVCYVLLWIKVW